MLIEKPRIPLRDVLLFGIWPGFIKVLLYRLKGYRIGKGVSIGFGSVIIGDKVEIGDHTSIGFLTIIRGKEIRLGRHVQVGSTTFLDTPFIEIGEGSKINEQVFVGGLQYPDSRFALGRNCQVMQMSFINPAKSVIIGDDSGVGGHSLIFGHSSWLNQFDGYPVSFEPIQIGNSVSLAWRVFVLPGSVIGDGAVIGANSLVSGKIPPQCLAVGFPARVVSRSPEFPKPLDESQKVQLYRNIVGEMLSYFTESGLICSEDGGSHVVRNSKRNWLTRTKNQWRLYVVEHDFSGIDQTHVMGNSTVVLSLSPIPQSVREQWSRSGVMWIDVANKQRSDTSNDLGEEVALFFKRYGVRVLRVSPQIQVPATN